VIYAMGWPEGKTTILGESLVCPFGFFVLVSEKAIEWKAELCLARSQSPEKKKKIEKIKLLWRRIFAIPKRGQELVLCKKRRGYYGPKLGNINRTSPP
jgi:hypothetical protein